MSYRIVCTDNFLKEAKKLQKKYPNIKMDFLDLKDILKKDPITGNDYLSDNCYKVRMAITDKGNGESGGARVIIQVIVEESTVYVVRTYDKGDVSTIKSNVLKTLLKKIEFSLRR